MEKKLATQRLISNVWTLEYEQVSETEIKILSYSDNNPIGVEKENELPRMAKTETGVDRIVTEIFIQPKKSGQSWADKNAPDTQKFTVINPQYVFSYNN